ncbi:SEC-C metal-binding domain-containing protein [Pigmentiphaga sp. YJ18]|uniref:SEC-C metal-binding domain-containing protein n=1 Tax=Pigmentiphaga sp. YJ18 TaxID=3134907 RepID=UPI004053C51C
MDSLIAKMKPAVRVREVLLQYIREVGRKKFGRNEPCNCGSGRKYEKCCLN